MRETIAVVCMLVLGYLCPTASAEQLRSIRTKHYLVRTDIVPAVADPLVKQVDLIAEEYARRFGRELPAGAGTVYLFADNKSYTTYVGERLAKRPAYYMERTKTVYACLGDFGRDRILQFLQHELVHNYIALSYKHPFPTWLNEGLAQYFEYGVWVDGRYTPGEIALSQVRLAQYAAHNHLFLPAEEILKSRNWVMNALDTPESRKAESILYLQSWTMVQFLANATDDNGNFRFRKRLINMLSLLDEGRPADKAFEEALSANYTAFQLAMEDWVYRQMRPTSAAMAYENQRVLGEMLVALKERGRSFSDFAQFRQFVVDNRVRLTTTDPNRTFQTSPMPGEYFTRADGRWYDQRQQYFEARPGARLPDIVCRCFPKTQLRVIFRTIGKETAYEVMAEPDGEVHVPPEKQFP